MKTTMNLATSKGFIFRNGKLMAYEFISALVDFGEGTVQYTCKLGGEETSFTTDECPVVFKDEASYEASVGNSGKEIRWIDAVSRVFNGPIREQYQIEGYCPLWMIESNEPVEKAAPLANYLYKEGSWRLEITYVGNGVYFRDRDTALLHCDLIVVDENGVETTRPSAANKMKLTDEQAAAVKAIEKAIEDAEKLGVQLVFDRDNCNFKAFSKTEVKSFEFDYSDEDVDYGDLMQRTNIDIYDANCYDCKLLITWKE